jgi:hypothetical protein
MNFLSRTQTAQQLRERIEKLDYMKLKSFWITNEIAFKLKRPPTDGRKCLLAIYQTRGWKSECTGSSKN